MPFLLILFTECQAECIRRALVQYCIDTNQPNLRPRKLSSSSFSFLLCVAETLFLVCASDPDLYLQVDNASDNKSRYVIGTLAWMVLKDLVHQVEVAMLPVGHTHEDIDQAFRIIAEALRCAGFVPTLDNYKRIIAEAWQGEHQHVEFVDAVHDYKNFVGPHVWETQASKDKTKGVLKGLTTAR